MSRAARTRAPASPQADVVEQPAAEEPEAQQAAEPLVGELIRNEDLDQVTTAVAVFDKVASGIATLHAKYKGVVFDVETAKGMEEARAARREIREPRYEVEKARIAAKRKVIALGSSLDARAEAITKQITEIEDPVHQQIATIEAREKADKEAKLQKERKRQETIRARIAAFASLPAECVGQSPAFIAEQIEKARATIIDEAGFGEWQATARATLETNLAKLQQMRDAAEVQAIEAERLRLQAIELERQRKEQEAARLEQERAAAAERARIAEEDRLARQAREAEQRQADETAAAQRAQQAEADRLERAKQDAERAAAIAAEQEKLRKIREEQAAADLAAQKVRDAENARQQAELERQRAELQAQRDELAAAMRARQEAANAAEEDRLATEIAAELPPVDTIARPTDQQIVECIAAEFAVDVETALSWVPALDTFRAVEPTA